MQRLPATLTNLAREVGKLSKEDAAALSAEAIHGVMRVAALLNPIPAALQAMTLADLLDDAWGTVGLGSIGQRARGRRRKRTLDLADKHGVIARSLSSNQRGIQLLPLQAEAFGTGSFFATTAKHWAGTALLAAEAPTSAGALPVRGLQQLHPNLQGHSPGVHGWGSPLWPTEYPAADGLPAGRSKAKLFYRPGCGAAWAPLPYPEPPELPEGRRPLRAVTPYFKRLLREGP